MVGIIRCQTLHLLSLRSPQSRYALVHATLEKYTRQQCSFPQSLWLEQNVYIFSFYFSPALKLIFQSKAKKRQTGLPTEMPNSCKTDRKESFCQVQRVWKKQMTLSGRLYQRERENRKSNQAQTQSHFLWQIPFHLLNAPLPKPSTMDHNASLLRVRCFKLVPLFAKQSPQRKAVKLAARDRKKNLILLLPQTVTLCSKGEISGSTLCVFLMRSTSTSLSVPSSSSFYLPNT